MEKEAGSVAGKKEKEKPEIEAQLCGELDFLCHIIRLSNRPFFSLFFLICSYFSLLFHENALLSLLFHSKMSYMHKNPRNFPRFLRSFRFYTFNLY